MPSRKIKPPTSGTLSGYGLTEDDWWHIVKRQNYTCPICQEPLGDRLLAVDHEHVRGFKAHKTVKRKKGKGRVKVRAMPPSERKLHVRGILHSFCNRYIRGWLTLARAASILEYLKSHEARRVK